MISADSFVQEGRRRGYDFYSGVPCSFLKPLINFVINTDELTYVAASNEGDAVAISSGAYLGGKKSVVMFQNSGLGNAVNPLTSLNYIFKIPTLIIVTLRGESGIPDEPQHLLMGDITTQLLDNMKIPWEYFPQSEDGITAAWQRASKWMDDNHLPYALVMKKNSVQPEKLPKSLQSLDTTITQAHISGSMHNKRMSRREVLQHIVDHTDENQDLIVASTGYNSRELYAVNDRSNQFYMVGSMGCASSIALGISMAQPDRSVIALEGDGAMLMRMGAVATIGFYKPHNLKHIVLDNETHESTGGQSTVTTEVDLAKVAHACGYPNVVSDDTPETLDDFVSKKQEALSFLHFKIKPGIDGELPRPSATPEQVKVRFMESIFINHVGANND